MIASEKLGVSVNSVMKKRRFCFLNLRKTDG
jgi:hypothetical protein